jgi:capsular exopolysaccharide synthesis family protein
MSRIDEALRRAAVGGGDTSASPPLRDPSLGTGIDRYPAEGPSAPDLDHRDGDDRRGSEPRRFQFLRALTQAPDRARLDTDVRLVSSNANFVGVEQYRRLAASLHDAQLASGLRVVTVTSALPRDGKTLTTVNLALTLSESYSRRVLVIDADLRRPSVHKMLGISNRVGLNEVLHGETHELPLVVVTQNLSVLTAGRFHEAPLAGLASDRMRVLLDACASRFDWVLLDVPPTGLLADAQILGHLTGAVILVIRAGVTPHALVERAITQIGRESIIGTVLNAVEEPATGAGKHYGNY